MIKIEKFSLYRFQYVQRHRRRSGVKIIHSFHNSHVPSCGEPQGNSLACNKKTPVPKKGREYTPALPPSLPFGHLVALYRAYPSNSSFDAPERNALLPCCLAPFRQLSEKTRSVFFSFIALLHKIRFIINTNVLSVKTRASKIYVCLFPADSTENGCLYCRVPPAFAEQIREACSRLPSIYRNQFVRRISHF
jgi:hypothetical protein